MGLRRHLHVRQALSGTARGGGLGPVPPAPIDASPEVHEAQGHPGCRSGREPGRLGSSSHPGQAAAPRSGHLRTHRLAHRPTHDAPRVQVHHRCDVDPAFSGPDVGEVRHPLLVRAISLERALSSRRRPVAIRVVVTSANATRGHARTCADGMANELAVGEPVEPTHRAVPVPALSVPASTTDSFRRG